MGEYNQCQLKYLYHQNIPGCNDKLFAYGVLYMLFSQNQSNKYLYKFYLLHEYICNIELNDMMEEMHAATSENDYHYMKHTLMVRFSLTRKNYPELFQLYENAPNMGLCLMN
jgi:hypothetical protein